MNKIRITESQLHRVIKESTKKVLREDMDYSQYYPTDHDGPTQGHLSQETYDALAEAESLLDVDIRNAEDEGSDRTEQFDKLQRAYWAIYDLLERYSINREER
jgi:hypothetical protein